jgi:hypothetical protein
VCLGQAFSAVVYCRHSQVFFKARFPFQDFSYERQELILQLNDLLSQRAGLQARWRALEEETRRAGAYPGWLRPR